MDLTSQPTFFILPEDFRNWLLLHHETKTELIVGFYKVGTGKACMTWSQSVDQALCFGWIDGLRKSIDQESYFIRFTPRKPNSIWSAVNIKKVALLSEQGLMHPKGIASFNFRTERNSKVYAFEQESVLLADEYNCLFKSNEKAWLFFQSVAPSYQKTAIHWVMTAKLEATRMRRLEELIKGCEIGQKLKKLSYGS